jgi:very-short-patch-repair endonuclease
VRSQYQVPELFAAEQVSQDVDAEPRDQRSLDPVPVSVEFDYDSVINYAKQQSDVPVIKSLRVTNTSKSALCGVKVSITTDPAFAEPWVTQIESIEAECSYSLGTVDLRLSPTFLSELTESATGHLIVELTCSDGQPVRALNPIRILAHDEWGGLTSSPEITAAFVLPNHPVTEGILSDAANILKTATGNSALSGYQLGSQQRVRDTIASIFTALQSLRIRYINPPASFEIRGQRVRLPDRILENRLGTCLDLSLLAAACIEQSGLNPLVVFTEGHAFPGVWTIEQCFEESAIDDGLKLKKRVELGEILVFESTLLTDNACSFQHAESAARRTVQNADSILCVLDIHRARMSSIRPLPSRVSKGAMLVEPPVHSDQAFIAAGTSDDTTPRNEPRPESKPTAGGHPDQETPSARLERWKRRLLDLSLRNRLLNFRRTRKTLGILSPGLASLEDALADGCSLRILPRPRDFGPNGDRSTDVHMSRTGNDPLEQLLSAGLRSHRLYADASTEAELKGLLTAIYRDARSSLEESGANTLYMALGFLKWYESETASVARYAPIVLVPLSMERKSVAEGFSVNAADDGPVVNTTLLEMLNHDFELRIPELESAPTDERGIDVDAVMRLLRQAVKDIDRWEITEDVYIGLFSFTKFVMWCDLQNRSNDLMTNRVVRHLINNPNDPFPSRGDLPDPSSLDEMYRPEDTFCPVDADSSQLAAVYAAAEGQSFVLEGPPGTGKSQTIANIIAHCLASGKTVLFVSEKSAALNVVFSRLQKVGLGQFCLPLHSNKSNKHSVIEQLGTTLDLSASKPPENWLSEASRLAELKRQLNSYVRALHAKRSGGETLFQGLSKLIGLRDIPQVELGWSPDQEVDADKLRHLRDTVDQLQEAARACGSPLHSPLKGIEQTDWCPALQADCDRALRALSDCTQRLMAAAQAIEAMLQFPCQQWSQETCRHMANVCRHLSECDELPMALITAPDWDAVRQSVDEWIALGRERDQLRTQLFATYSANLMSLDLLRLRARLDQADASWALPRWFARQSVRRRLKVVSVPGHSPMTSQLRSDINQAITLQQKESHLAAVSDKAREILGHLWRDGQADWQKVELARDISSLLRGDASAIAGHDADLEARLRSTWGALAALGKAERSGSGEVGRLLVGYHTVHNEFEERLSSLSHLLSLDQAAAFGEPSAPGFLNRVSSQVQLWIKHSARLRTWCYWRSVRRKAIDEGLGRIVCYCESQADIQSVTDLVKVFDRAFYAWWTTREIGGDPLLCGFVSSEFERRIREFRRADERLMELTVSEIQARLAARIPNLTRSISNNSEPGVLRREMQKKRRHIPIRTLFQRIPNLLPLLKPCLLMSPMSVAQYLDPSHPKFDLIIFDEASQMPVWDAIGAISRGTEVVVVGDPKQLPPTTFFSRLYDDDTDTTQDPGAADAVEDLESILDDCIAAGLPTLRLQWHYRSKHESLIAFSNYHYYGNRLLTFPSPFEGKGVSLRMIADGTYDRGKSHTNRSEADAVVAEVVRRLCDPDLSRQSIGIVTFNVNQQMLIEDLLEEARSRYPSIDEYFSPSCPEPVFVKNLENVQGDERDVILFSVCYGQDSAGRVYANFGPLNNDGGERRLNVAVTRARQEMVVFSSISADQIDLARTRALGVAHLKAFLDYAARGTSVLTQAMSVNSDADFDSPFERQVCETLRRRGREVHLQVGCSGYRVDLAVVDPRRPGRYLLGIECDGATYHRAKTARDRDRLRESVLRGLGWRLLRIWSTDWWEDPDSVLTRIENAISDAMSDPCEPVTAIASPTQSARSAQTPSPVDTAAERTSAIQERLVASLSADFKPSESVEAPHLPGQAYEPYRSSEPAGDPDAFYQRTNSRQVREVMERVLEVEGPVSFDTLVRRVAAQYLISKVTRNVQARIEALLPSTFAKRQKADDTVFLWPRALAPDEYHAFRVPSDDPDSQRDVLDIAPREIANGVLFILEQALSIPREDLVRETARLFGFRRTGTRVVRRIEAGIRLLVNGGQVQEKGSMCVLASHPSSPHTSTHSHGGANPSPS